MTVRTPRPQSEVPANLLPPQIQAQQRVQRMFVYAAIGAGIIVVVLAAISLFMQLRINDANSSLEAAEAQASSLRTQVAALQEFEQLNLSVQQTRSILATALQGDVSWSKFLDDLDSNMPDDSSLSSLTLAAAPGTSTDGTSTVGTVQYQGFVRNFPRLSDWLDTMSGIKGLNFVYLSNAQKQEGKLSFSASANLTEPMLSHRCEQETSPCP